MRTLGLRPWLSLTVLSFFFSPLFAESAQSANNLPPEITDSRTYREGDLVFFELSYTDPNNDAEGFGFRGAKGAGWAEEEHPFSNPSYGRVSQGKIAYPFNVLCDTGPAYESDVEAWIYDRAGLRSPSVTVHLACNAGGSNGIGGKAEFEDDFEPDRDPRWATMEGNSFNVVNGKLTSVGRFKAHVGDASWRNYAVDFDLVNLIAANLGILIRRQSDTDHIRLSLLNSCFGHLGCGCGFDWAFVKEGKEEKVTNSFTLIKDASVGCVGHYRIEVSGNKILFFKNSKQYFDFAIDYKVNNFPNGNVGLSVYNDDNTTNFTIDNFKVTSLP